jgi:hypothetical protein
MRTEADRAAIPSVLEGADLAAAIALAVFFVCYSGALIGYVTATAPPPSHDAFGQPIPDLRGEAFGYITVGILLAFLSHLLVFIAFRWRLRSWPLRALVPLQLVTVAGSLGALRVIDPVVAVLLAPASVTCIVYGIAMLIVRAEHQSPL